MSWLRWNTGTYDYFQVPKKGQGMTNVGNVLLSNVNDYYLLTVIQNSGLITWWSMMNFLPQQNPPREAMEFSKEAVSISMWSIWHTQHQHSFEHAEQHSVRPWVMLEDMSKCNWTRLPFLLNDMCIHMYAHILCPPTDPSFEHTHTHTHTHMHHSHKHEHSHPHEHALYTQTQMHTDTPHTPLTPTHEHLIHIHTHTHIHSPPPPTPQKDNRKSCCFNTKTTNHTHIDTKVLGEPSASGPQHTKGQALVQHDAHFVLQLQLQLPTQTNPPTVLDDSVPNFTSCFSQGSYAKRNQTCLPLFSLVSTLGRSSQWSKMSVSNTHTAFFTLIFIYHTVF